MTLFGHSIFEEEGRLSWIRAGPASRDLSLCKKVRGTDTEQQAMTTEIEIAGRRPLAQELEETGKLLPRSLRREALRTL